MGRLLREVGQTLRYKMTQGSYELAGALYTGQAYRGDLGLLTSQPTAGVTGGAVYQRTEANLAAQQHAAASQQPTVSANRGLSL